MYSKYSKLQPVSIFTVQTKRSWLQAESRTFWFETVKMLTGGSFEVQAQLFSLNSPPSRDCSRICGVFFRTAASVSRRRLEYSSLVPPYSGAGISIESVAL